MNKRDTTIFITNIPPQIHKSELQYIFSKFGHIEAVILPQRRSYALIQFENVRSCEEAIKALNKESPYNFVVEMAKHNKPSVENYASFQQNYVMFRNKGSGTDEKKIMFLDTDRIYLDRFDRKVDGYCDENGEVYVPLARVTGIKCAAIINFNESGTESDVNSVDSFEKRRHRSLSRGNYVNEKSPNNSVQNDHNGKFVKDHRLSDQKFHESGRLQQKRNCSTNQYNNSYDEQNIMEMIKSAPANVRRTFNSLSVTVDNAKRHVEAKTLIQESDENDKDDCHDESSNRSINSPGSKSLRKTSFVKSSTFFPNQRSEDKNKENWKYKQSFEKNQCSKPVEKILSSDSFNCMRRQFSQDNIGAEKLNEEKSFEPAKEQQQEQKTLPVKSSISNVEEAKACMKKKDDTGKDHFSKIEQNFLVGKSSVLKAEEAKVDITKQCDKENGFCKSVELPRDKFTSVEVQTMVNEYVAWVQICDNADFLNQLMEKILKSCPAPLSGPPELGQLCLAKYEDYWFRAIVLQVSPAVRVKFIDYGNESEDPEGGLLQLAPEFCLIPAQAVCIKLVNGSPCTITHDQLRLNVKPVGKENDLILVHVKNGIYSDDENNSKTQSPVIEETVTKIEDPYDKIRTALFSEIKIGQMGFLEKTVFLSENKFLAFIVMCENTENLACLDQITCNFDPDYKAKIGDLTIVEHDDRGCRGLILDMSQNNYEVALIDYALIKNVSKIHPIPEYLLLIPQYSCISEFSGEDADKIAELKDMGFSVNNIIGNTVNIKTDNSIDLKLQPWHPLEIKKQSTLTENIRQPSIPDLKMKIGEAVRIICENGDYLYLRTKTGHETLKRVDSLMSTSIVHAKSLSSMPAVGEIVAAEYEDHWYRAIVKSVKDKLVVIFYIDYGNEEEKPLKFLKTLPADLYKEPLSLAKIKLKGFNGSFSERQLFYIENVVHKRVVLKVNNIDETKNEADLMMKSGSTLTDELKNILKTNESLKHNSSNNSLKTAISNDSIGSMNSCKDKNIVSGVEDPTAINIIAQEVPLGKVKIKYLADINLSCGSFCFCLEDEQFIKKVLVDLTKDINDYVTKTAQTGAYAPSDNEFVLAQNDGLWLRANAIQKHVDNQANLFFVDYGISKIISYNNIRRMPAKYVEPAALANFGVINGIENVCSEKLVKRLDGLLRKDKVHVVNILEKIDSDGTYVMDFPSIMPILKKEHLL